MNQKQVSSCRKDFVMDTIMMHKIAPLSNINEALAPDALANLEHYDSNLKVQPPVYRERAVPIDSRKLDAKFLKFNKKCM